jgi:hypothetical protein
MAVFLFLRPVLNRCFSAELLIKQLCKRSLTVGHFSEFSTFKVDK